MKTLLAALVVAPVLLSGVAMAEPTLSASQFVRANRCVAFASLPALQGTPVDLTGVKARVAESRSGQTAQTLLTVQSFARDAQARGSSANSAQAIDDLLARRDRYCSSFVDATQLAARTATTSQQ